MRNKRVILGFWIGWTVFADGGAGALNSTIDEALGHMRRGEYLAAQPLLRDVIAQMESAALPDSRLGPMLNNLGAALYYTSQIGEAEQFYLRARDELKAGAGLDYASVLNNLGTLYRNVGEFGKAEAVQLEALRIHGKTLSPNSPEIGVDIRLLADLHFRTADYERAEQEARRAVGILSAQDTESAAFADSLQCLASILQMRDVLEEAEELQQRALNLREALLGANDPKVATSLVALADLRTRQHDFVHAEELLWRALAIWRQNPQLNEAHIGTALNNLGQIAKLTNRFSEAERLYRNALEVWEASLGRTSVDYAFGLGNLGDLYRIQGRLFGAAGLFRQSLAILEPKLGSRNPTVIAFTASLRDINHANRLQRQQTVDFHQLLKK